MKLKFIFILIFLLAITSRGLSQIDSFQSTYFSTTLGYSGIKDQMNYGFVFRGPEAKLDFGYRLTSADQYFDISLSVKGMGHFTSGLWGFGLHISPISTSKLFSVLKNDDINLLIGPTFNSKYRFNNFVAIHSGHMSWMSNYSLGLNALVITSFKGKRLELTFENSFISLTSRPQLEIEPYWYDLSFADWLNRGHENMSVDLVNEFYYSKIQVELFFQRKKRRHSIVYSGQYVVYSGEPNYQQINHSISYRWYFNKSKS